MLIKKTMDFIMDELVEGFNKNEVLSSFSDKVLELIIFPTEQCNFRCTYCYEDFEIGKMSDDTVQGIKNLLANRIPHLKRLNLSWFGGEPLLQQKMILDIASFAYDLCQQYKVTFTGGFTTNGYLLTPDLLSKFNEINQTSYQISLDGDKETHNQTRISRAGSATFDRIWNNLIEIKDLKDIQYNITLRVHLTINNFDSTKSLITKISKHFGNDARFNVHFHKVSDLGGPNNIGVLNHDEYITRLNILQKQLGNDLEHNNEYEINKSSKYICYAAKANSLTIRANGRIGKCTVALSDPRNDLGKILPTGKLEINNTKLKPWLHGFSDMNEQSLGCPVSTLHKHKINSEDIIAIEVA